MTWLIWRQHRGEVLGAAIVGALLLAVLVLHGLPMHAAFERDGVGACQLRIFGADASECVETVMSFERAWAGLPAGSAAWLPFLPMLAGMLVGAPLLAREYEQGTWQLVWTQTVTRRRWLAHKLALVVGGVAAASVVFASGVSWWFEPLAAHAFTPETYNHAVLVFPAYVVVAVAIGILAGAVARRTVVAAAVTVAGYLALRLPMEFYLRQRFRQPITTEDPAAVAQGWVLAEGGVPAPGSAAPAGPVRFHPEERFWEFQLIEACLLLGVAAVLLAITWRLVLGARTHRA